MVAATLPPAARPIKQGTLSSDEKTFADIPCELRKAATPVVIEMLEPIRARWLRRSKALTEVLPRRP